MRTAGYAINRCNVLRPFKNFLLYYYNIQWDRTLQQVHADSTTFVCDDKTTFSRSIKINSVSRVYSGGMCVNNNNNINTYIVYTRPFSSNVYIGIKC